MKFLADLAHKRRWLVLAVWIFAIVAVGGAAKSAGSAFSSSFQLPDTESSRVQEILSKEFPAQGGDSSQIVIEAKGKLTSVENQAIVEKLMADVATSPIVKSVDSPFDPRNAALNADQSIGFATIHFNGSAQDLPKEEIKKVVEVAQSYENAGLEINLQKLRHTAIEPDAAIGEAEPAGEGVCAAQIEQPVAKAQLRAGMGRHHTPVGGVGVDR